MRARFFYALLVIGLGCGPDIESTSETLDTGSVESDAQESSTDNDPSASGNDPCAGETPPGVLAYLDALDRMEQAFAEIAADVDVVRMELAGALGLPADASTDAVVAALEASYAANLGPGSALLLGAHRCTGGLVAARENLAICDPALVVADVAFACEGDCTVAAAAECPSPRCRGTASQCDGTCIGACVQAAPASACDGVCTGICDGDCSCVDGVDECVGACSGICAGACTGIDTACTGDCDGICVGTITGGIAECDGTWSCDAPGFACTLDCSGWAVAIDVGSGCGALASAAGAASESCAPPFATLVVDSTVCSSFVSMVPALEDAAARLRRDLDRLQTLIDRTQSAVSPFIAAIIESVDLPPCVLQLVLENVNAFEGVITAASEVRLDAARLFDALDP